MLGHPVVLPPQVLLRYIAMIMVNMDQVRLQWKEHL